MLKRSVAWIRSDINPKVAQSVGKKGLKAKELMLLWRFTDFLLSAAYVGAIGSLLVVPVKQHRLKTFQDLAENHYHIQMRGNTSSTYSITDNCHK